MTATLKFDDGYQERLRLRSGERIKLRLVSAGDRQRLSDGFGNLSSASRQKRFFGAKQSLSAAELRYFTEVDQIDHFAIGVVELHPGGQEGDGIGIARFIRHPSDSECAEVAITVIDRMQGKGVGRLLLEKLIEAAVDRRIRRFRFECLMHNVEIQRLVQRVCNVINTRSETGVMVAEVDLPGRHLGPGKTSGDAFDGLFALLRAFAADNLELHMDLGLQSAQYALDAWFAPRADWLEKREDRALD